MKQAARALCIVVASVASAGGGVACQAFFGVDPSEDAATSSGDDPGAGGGSGSTTSGAGATSCSCLAPPVGEGWEGPFHIGEYAPGLGPTSCPGGGAATRLYVGHQPASCGTCACGAVAGASCPTQVLCYPSTNCTGTPTDQAAMFSQQGLDPGGCYLWSGANPYSCKVVQDPATGGGCEIQSGAATVAGWESERVLCRAPTGDGCGEGDVCAAADPAGKVCYTNMSDVACPEGWDAPYVGYTGLQGELSCSGCSCAAPTGVGCSTAQYAFHAVTFPICYTTVALASACADVSGLEGFSTFGAPVPSGGGCVASGGVPSSQPTPTGYTSVCCKTL